MHTARLLCALYCDSEVYITVNIHKEEKRSQKIFRVQDQYRSDVNDKRPKICASNCETSQQGRTSHTTIWLAGAVCPSPSA